MPNAEAATVVPRLNSSPNLKVKVETVSPVMRPCFIRAPQFQALRNSPSDPETFSLAWLLRVLYPSPVRSKASSKSPIPKCNEKPLMDPSHAQNRGPGDVQLNEASSWPAGSVAIQASPRLLCIGCHRVLLGGAGHCLGS